MIHEQQSTYLHRSPLLFCFFHHFSLLTHACRLPTENAAALNVLVLTCPAYCPLNINVMNTNDLKNKLNVI